MADTRFRFQISPAGIDKFCLHARYPATIRDPANPSGMIPNPETKPVFVGRKIQEYINGQIGEGAVEASVNTRKAEDAAARAAAAIAPVEVT